MEPFDDRYDDLFRDAARAAIRVVGDARAAEEVAQEACYRALVRWSKVADYATPWVIRVSTNLAIDELRRRAKRAPIDDAGLDGAEDLPPDRAEEVLQLVSGLSKRQRDALVLRYVHDFSDDQIARALGCSTGAVHSHVHRGLAKLRGHNQTQEVLA
jgi:RNA polymerase sigma factor (sigma-70 family)